MKDPAYLGDGVYVDYNGYAVIIAKNNHLNLYGGEAIVLEPEMMEALYEYYLNKRGGGG